MTVPFSTIEEFGDLLKNLPKADDAALAGANAHNAQLTKPPRALGRLEDIAIWYSSWRGDVRPQIKSPQVAIFAGNHGVTAQGVSAFPAEVTHQMVLNFEHGGAAINQLCKAAGANLTVLALDLDKPTADFTQGPAMSEDEFVDALARGWLAVSTDSDLFVAGEMGIGNTTSAAAIANALFGGTADDWVGRGTGVDDAGLALKSDVVTKALLANPARDGLSVLRALGGRELAAMVGAITRARSLNIPVILDGFICSAAAACLHAVSPDSLDHCIAGHKSDEMAHTKILKNLNKVPLLDLNMRLGEGSGGALAINIVKSAIACHSGMATFAEAGVSDA